jgi:hypothetical protein
MLKVALTVVIAGFCPAFGCIHEESNAGAHPRNAGETASLADLGPAPGHEDETSAQPIAPARL